MTKVVGIDFGTTNVRIAEWETSGSHDPASCRIGSGGTEWMPAVIAFRRMPGGTVETVIGEDADILDDASDDIEVIRNIKRWATTSDHYVRRYLEMRFQEDNFHWPKWWDPESRTIRLWQETIHVEEAIGLILKEAIDRAGLAGAAAEWRAGCPVNSDFVYRRALVSALAELGCTGRIEWVTEEPLLLLALGVARGSLADGSYLVYDLGGGSFDCAIAEVRGTNITVYSEEGLPTSGGMDIDETLRRHLSYDGSDHDLRVAKEQLSAGSRSEIALPGGHTLTNNDLDKALKHLGLIPRTLIAALDAYKKAKLLWNRTEGSPPYGETIVEESEGEGFRRLVWSLDYSHMARDIDRVLLVGGPTLMVPFRRELGKVFGSQKIVMAPDLVSVAGRAGIANAQLTALSHGGCHMLFEQYIPITVDRIPASITLSVTDGDRTIEDSYEPYRKLPWHPPMSVHQGREIQFQSKATRTYAVRITSPDGGVLYDSGTKEARMPRDRYRGPRADRIRMIVDRLGSVWVKMGAGFTDVPRPTEDDISVVRHPVWQSEAQREAIERLHEEQRLHEEELAARLHRNLHNNPFGHHERSG